MPFITEQLKDTKGPVVAVSDFMRAVQDQISRWVPNDYTSLGTDGWGLADTRAAARRHFHVDAESIVVATLEILAKRGDVKPRGRRRGGPQVPHRRPHRGRRRKAGGRRRLTPTPPTGRSPHRGERPVVF